MSQKVPIWEQNGTPQDMSHTPKFDLKVQAILDATRPGERICALTGERWMMTDEEIGWYKKFNVPPPKVSPRTRWYVHGFWYTGYQFWYQKHPKTGKPVLTTVHPSSGIKVLPDAEWFEQEFLEHGSDYKIEQSFFDQVRQLQLSVPSPACRNHKEPKNSIVFVSQGDEDSFFVGASSSKRCLYSHICTDIEDSAEIYLSQNIQQSFHVVHSSRIFNGKFVRESRDCLNSAFLFDCRNCEFCFGATNKRNKKYLWWNEQLSQEDWKQRMEEVDFGSRKVLDEYVRRFEQLVDAQGIWPSDFNENADDSTGEYLTRVTRVQETYMAEPGASNLYWCNLSIGSSQNCAFTGYPVWATNAYYCVSVKGNNLRFCFLCIACQNVEYSLLCYNCENCFGCMGLQRKKFCIFNKQYSEDEYWQRVDALKCAMLERGEYGEFFPVKYSPSYWKDAGSIPWFGASEEDAHKMGVQDYDPESQGAIGQELVDALRVRNVSDVPDHIRDLSDEWANVPLLDAACGRRFALIKPEIDFYRRMHLAPPRKHFISRIKDLFLQANQGYFIDADCRACQAPLKVARNLAHPVRTIYCRPCYLEYLEKNG